MRNTFRPGKRRLEIANPHEKGDAPPWVLWFGTSGTAFVLAYADSLEDALETAAEYLLAQRGSNSVTERLPQGNLWDHGITQRGSKQC